MRLDQGGMYPEQGVAATRPAMVPEQNPTMVNFLSILQSSMHQVKPPMAAQIMLFQVASTALMLAPKAEPALKPIQPNLSSI